MKRYKKKYKFQLGPLDVAIEDRGVDRWTRRHRYSVAVSNATYTWHSIAEPEKRFGESIDFERAGAKEIAYMQEIASDFDAWAAGKLRGIGQQGN